MSRGLAVQKFAAMENLVRGLSKFAADTDVSRLQVLVSVMSDAEMEMYVERLNAVERWAKENEQIRNDER